MQQDEPERHMVVISIAELIAELDEFLRDERNFHAVDPEAFAEYWGVRRRHGV